VLASGVIHGIKAPRSVVYYYCDYADKRTLEPTNLFGSLARQVLELVNPIPEELSCAIELEEHDGEQFVDPSRTFAFFERALKILPGSVYVVLDGLDEASEESQKSICVRIGQCLGSEYPVKLFITGRDDLMNLLGITDSVPQLRIAMKPDSNAADIESYIREEVRRLIAEGCLAVKNSPIEELIVAELIKGARGM
jgi:hypothetical protein